MLEGCTARCSFQTHFSRTASFNLMNQKAVKKDRLLTICSPFVGNNGI